MLFSNSVIEHVGDDRQQERFAEQVLAFGVSYWVQTPSKWFPIEAHSGMPYWGLYPAWLQSRFLKRWRPTLPEWTQMIEETRVLSKRRLATLFPEAEIVTERFAGVPKSYVARSIRTPSPETPLAGVEAFIDDEI